MARTQTTAITRKAMAGGGGAGVGEALSTILVWALEAALQAPVPDKVSFSIGLLFNVGFALLFAYLMPPASDEGVVNG